MLVTQNLGDCFVYDFILILFSLSLLINLIHSFFLLFKKMVFLYLRILNNATGFPHSQKICRFWLLTPLEFQFLSKPSNFILTLLILCKNYLFLKHLLIKIFFNKIVLNISSCIFFLLASLLKKLMNYYSML